mgnify:FL=1
MANPNPNQATQFSEGNQAAADGRRWRQAINRAVSRKKSARSKVIALDALADKLVEAGLAGDISALKEIGNRLDGMAHQSISVDQHSDRTVLVNLSFVKPVNVIENQPLASLPDEMVIHQPVIERPKPVMVEQINQDEPLT